MTRYFERFGPAALLLLLLLGWDMTGLDMTLAHWAGTEQGFALRDNWLFADVLHTGMRYAAWVAVVILCAAAVWPFGFFTRLPFARRVQLPAVAFLSTGAISALKAFSGTSCPWDLSEFGGVAHHVTHWAGWRIPDGGGGHCFPAGHASAGFAFVGGWFALRHDVPRVAKVWLVATICIGLILGLAQQWRGAHFMSHTLWTGWMCWVVAVLTDPWFESPAIKELA
jgi:membrane-associated PAP2 superfamily phosphatase